MGVGFTTTYMQSVPITTDVVHEFESRSGRAVQNYGIQFVSDLRQVDGSLRILQFSQPIKPIVTI
jgi:hypothetical protein